MITFDQNGVATPESQTFFENEHLRIVQDSSMSQAQKASRLRDLYNQYGLEYGTFNRKGRGADHYSEKLDTIKSDTNSSTAIIFTVVLMALLVGIYFADHWFVDQHIDFSIAKEIERFFQWIFS